MAEPKESGSILVGWMRGVLRVAGGYNLAAGLAMIVFYHEGYRWLGINKPDLTLPIQLVGMMVALFGIAYLLVDRDPVANRNLLRLGFLSKLLGPALAVGYIISGVLPVEMLVVLLLADLVYLPPFWMIDQQIGKHVRSQRSISLPLADQQARRAA